MRVSWEIYFMNIAKQAATRGTCTKRHVGAIIVRDKNILATGYNGSLPSLEHCNDVGCDLDNGHCVRTLHAEASAITQAAKNGIKVNGAIMYCTDAPCWNCFKLVVNSGIKSLVVSKDYKSDRVDNAASNLNFEIRKI